MKWNTKHYVRLITLILLGGVLFLGAAGCTPTPGVPAEEEPDDVAVAPIDTNPGLDTTFDVKREAATAWATLTDLDVMDELTTTSWQNLLDGGQVSVNADGEAQLRSATCSSIYLFDSGGLKLSSCSEEDLGTDTSCAVSGTSYFDDCGLQVQTASADLSWPGTTLSVSYLERNADVMDAALSLTLVIALDGEVKVDPVTDIASRSLGEAILVPAGSFTYTTPDDVLEAVAQFTGVAPRAVLPLSELPPLAASLGIEPAVEKVQDRADQDGFPFPPADTASSGTVITVNVGGAGLLNQDRAFNILAAVDWHAILDTMFPQGESDLLLAIDEPPLSIRELISMGHEDDIAIAQEIVAAFVDEGGEPVIRLLIPPGDDLLARVAALIQKDLARIDLLEVMIEELPSQAEVDAMIEKGEEMMWLTR